MANAAHSITFPEVANDKFNDGLIVVVANGRVVEVVSRDPRLLGTVVAFIEYSDSAATGSVTTNDGEAHSAIIKFGEVEECGFSDISRPAGFYPG